MNLNSMYTRKGRRIGLVKKIFTAVLALNALFCLWTLTVNAEVDSSCKQTRRSLQEASEIRNLNAKRDVPCRRESKAEIRRFLQRSLEQDLPPERLQHEETLYKAIGLLPEQYDYKQGLISFLVSQVGGYYDPKTKRFIMADWIPVGSIKGVLIHELTHALQDQHFDLLDFIDPKNLTTDEGLARMALVEGDASAVMFDAMRAKARLPRLSRETSIDSIILAQVLGQGMIKSVPESIKAMMLFPYTSGLRYAHALLREGGYSRINMAFKSTPRTSREILHPEEYLQRSFRSAIPRADEVIPGRLVYSDVLGEFGISSIFAGRPSQKLLGVKAAVGWMGDRAVIVEQSNATRVVGWLTRWETSQDAAEFCQIYREYLEYRYGPLFSKEGRLKEQTRGVSLHCATKEVLFTSSRLVNT